MISLILVVLYQNSDEKRLKDIEEAGSFEESLIAYGAVSFWFDDYETKKEALEILIRKAETFDHYFSIDHRNYGFEDLREEYLPKWLNLAEDFGDTYTVYNATENHQEFRKESLRKLVKKAGNLYQLQNISYRTKRNYPKIHKDLLKKWDEISEKQLKKVKTADQIKDEIYSDIPKGFTNPHLFEKWFELAKTIEEFETLCDATPHDSEIRVKTTFKLAELYKKKREKE